MMPWLRKGLQTGMFSVPHMIDAVYRCAGGVGPHKLPELARGLGKLMAEFRKASTDFKLAFEEEMRNVERAGAGGRAEEADGRRGGIRCCNGNRNGADG